MKKIYSSMLAFGVAFGATAQVAQQSVQQVKRNIQQQTVALEQPVSAPSVAATGDTISGLYYDMSDQNNWMLSNTSSPAYDWEFVSAIPTNLTDLNYDAALNSETPTEFALVNSDGQGTGTTQECILQLANPVDLSGFGSVNLVWTQYYRLFTGDAHYVEFSIDGGSNWVSTQVNGAASAAASDNPEYATLNISGAANAASVLIRFRYTGAWGLWWALDDVAFVEGASDDLILNKTFYGDVVGDWEYALTPVAQTVPVYLGAVVTNNGGNTATNVICTYDITMGATSVESGSFAIGSGTIASAATDTGWYDTGYTPSTIGEYVVSYSITSDATDQVPANNDASATFETSEFEWSHEREDLWDGQYGGYVVSATDQTALEYSQGSVFYPVVTADLSAIKVSFGAATSATVQTPIALSVEVHEIGASIQDIVNSEYQAVDISSTGWYTFILDDPISLAAGTGYILAVTTTGGTDVMALDGWGVDEDFGAANNGPFGTGGAVNWYNGWDYSSAIRGVFNPDITGIEENADVSGVTIYPNPTTDILNINFVSKENQNVTINVIGVDGALVFSENLTTKIGQASRTTVDFANLAKGIYMVQLVGSNSSLTQRVVVQ
jgi:hypothetical protein